MKRYALLAVVLLSLAATANALQADRSSYDPMAHQWQAQRHKGIVETTLAGINPQNRNYGAAVGDWRKEVFKNTLHEIYFWSLILLGMGFGVSLTGNGWLLRDRERRLTISADIVTQLFNAHIGCCLNQGMAYLPYRMLVDSMVRTIRWRRRGRSQLRCQRNFSGRRRRRAAPA